MFKAEVRLQILKFLGRDRLTLHDKQLTLETVSIVDSRLITKEVNVAQSCGMRFF